jgi:predicted MFS family arabinose efflux permease
MKQSDAQSIDTTHPAEPAIPRVAVPLLSFAAFGSGIILRVTDPMLPQLASEFAVTLGDASLVITVFSISYGFSQLLFGPLGDRYGKYFVIACASAACALTTLLCGLAPGFSWLLGARLLSGATAAALIPLAMAWIGDVVPYQDRQPVLARFLIGQILGLAAGVLVGGLAADVQNWRLPFFMVTIIFAMVGASLFALNRRLPAHARQTRRVEGAAIPRMIGEFRQILQSAWARRILLTVFLEGAFLYGAFAFIASHVHHTFGLSLTASGAMVMLFGLGGFVFALLSRLMVQRLGEAGLSRWGGVSLAASLIGIGIAPVWWWAIVGCFIAGLGFYMLHNTLQINATQMAPERRGAAVSAFASSFFLGQSLGVGLAGVLVEHIGTRNILVAGGVGVLAVAISISIKLAKKEGLASS